MSNNKKSKFYIYAVPSPKPLIIEDKENKEEKDFFKIRKN